MNKIKIILFDMDGVLVDAKEWHYKALNQALKIFGMGISMQDHLANYDGLSTKQKLEILSKEKNFSSKLHPFISELKQYFTNQIIINECIPSFKHQYALSKLKNLGYNMAVCSNSIRKTISLMLEMSEIDHYFDFYLSNEDVLNPKPNPEIYNLAMSKFNAKPENCLIIEDNERGINSATASGAHVLVIKDYSDFNFKNIINKIKELEK